MKAKVAPEIELHPDAMQLFERALAQVVKAPPQHRVKAKKSKAKSLAKKARNKG